MSRSVHTSRAKFRKAFQFDYSTDEERTRVLGKIIDELGVKRAMKESAREKKKSVRAGVKPEKIYSEFRAAASSKTPPTDEAKDLVRRHNLKGYGRSDTMPHGMPTRHYAKPQARKDAVILCGAKVTATDIILLRQQATSDPNKATCPRCLALIAKGVHEK